MGLKIQQLNETKKNLELTIQELKQVRIAISRLERERKEANESLQTLQDSNDQIRQQILKIQGDLKVSNE